MPEINNIIVSVQQKQLIKDPFIKQGSFIQNRRDVVHYSGGFTVVFPVEVNGEKWAFRCWHNEIGNVAKRFIIISQYIYRLNSPYLCEFTYCDEGIVVDGKTFPTTRMKWADGDTLDQYLLDNKDNSTALTELASSFVELVDFLHEHHIAHGDLQHGNIIVNDGHIVLVDYDSMYVPGLDGYSDLVIGKLEYQHPKRAEAKIVSEKLDYFSELVIYLSILAIAKQPDIIIKFPINDSLIFKSSDWSDFSNSEVYTALQNINDDTITLLLRILVDYLNTDDINKLEPFTDIWKNLSKEPKIIYFTCGNSDGIVLKDCVTRITWQVENVEKQFINGIEVPIESNHYEMAFDGDADVELTLVNGLHILTLSKHITAVEIPSITFKAEKTTLRKQGQTIEPTFLSWNVQNATVVKILSQGQALSTAITNSHFSIAPQHDTTYTILVFALDNTTVFKENVEVIVREPAKIEFKADKEYSLPKVPVTIWWNVENAISVKLNDQPVNNTGSEIVTPEKDEQYILTIVDDFEEISKQIEIKMLPLPFVRSMVVDLPKINNDVIIQYVAPRFTPTPPLPKIDIDYVNINIDPIPDLRDTGVFVNAIEEPKHGLLITLSNLFKRIFNHQ